MSISWISPEQLSELRKDQQQSILCLDIRSEQEHQQNHIPGSCLVDQQNILHIPAESILVYCQTGTRTEMLKQHLGNPDNKQIYLLEGGLDAWVAKGMGISGSQSSGLSLQRQVHMIAGILILTFTLLSLTISPYFMAGTAFVGGGLTLAGLTGFCGMAKVLALAPWNRPAGVPGSA